MRTIRCGLGLLICVVFLGCDDGDGSDSDPPIGGASGAPTGGTGGDAPDLDASGPAPDGGMPEADAGQSSPDAGGSDDGPTGFEVTCPDPAEVLVGETIALEVSGWSPARVDEFRVEVDLEEPGRVEFPAGTFRDGFWFFAPNDVERVEIRGGSAGYTVVRVRSVWQGAVSDPIPCAFTVIGPNNPFGMINNYDQTEDPSPAGGMVTSGPTNGPNGQAWCLTLTIPEWSLEWMEMFPDDEEGPRTSASLISPPQPADEAIAWLGGFLRFDFKGRVIPTAAQDGSPRLAVRAFVQQGEEQWLLGPNLWDGQPDDQWVVKGATIDGFMPQSGPNAPPMSVGLRAEVGAFRTGGGPFDVEFCVGDLELVPPP